MSEINGWPLPYLIEFMQAKPASILLQLLPQQDIMTDEIPGLGSVEIRTGGPTWDLNWEMRDSIRDIVPDTVRAQVNTDPKSPSDLIKNDAVFIVSHKFKDAVEPWLKNTEFIQMRLELRTERTPRTKVGRIREDYFWMNCWNRLDLIDIDNSDLGMMPSRNPDSQYYGSPVTIGNWKNLRLRNLPDDEHLFGLGGLIGGRRFLSPHLHRVIMDAGLDVRFQPVPQDMRPRPTFNEQMSSYLKALNPHVFGGVK